MKIPINENVLQALLIALNFIFALLSASLVGLGIVYMDDLSLIEIYVTRISFLKLPTVLIILGAISLISSMIGCYIVRNCSRTSLKIYIIFLVLLLAVELTIGIMAFLNVTEATTTKTHMKMTKLLDTDAKIRSDFYVIEEHFSCCGINNVDDYKSDKLVLHNGTLCHRSFNRLSMQELNGCAVTVVANIARISFEIGGCMTVYAFLQIIDIACLVMILMQM